MMAFKTEHAGAKNGGGYWGKRSEAKHRSKRLRRKEDRKSVLRGAIENGVKENDRAADRIADILLKH
ncbi:MAG: hypothetical protein WC840_06390 [Candidatus Peribacteraceae bacterium]